MSATWTRLALLAQDAAYPGDAVAGGGWFSDIDAEQRFVLTIIALSCLTLLLIVISAIIATAWGAVNRRRLEDERRQIEDDMKRDMLDRGMTADEIAKIIEATAPPEDGLGRWLANCGKKK